MEREMWFLIATAIAGIAAAILVLIFSTSGEHPTMRTLRCSMGFLVAVIWIMAIADEVVGVLKVNSKLTSRVPVLIPPGSIRLLDSYLDCQMPSSVSPFSLSETRSRISLRI